MSGLSLRDRFTRASALATAAAGHGGAGIELAQGLRRRGGTRADYAALAEHHYRAAKPATMTRVLVLEDPRPTVVGRYLGRRDQTRPVGVLVESLPSLSCRMRDWATRARYGRHLSPRGRAALLNAELRCISRVVIDPRWRGLGLAVGLVRWALDEPTTELTEALAAMGRVNPFFERAGMTAYPRPTHRHDARFIAALARVGLAARDLARGPATWHRIDTLPGPQRTWLLKELKAWYRLNAGRSADYETDPQRQLVVARQRLLLEPVYYLKDHR